MPYSKVHDAWEDAPSSATPIDAAALGQIESGIAAAQSDVDDTAAAVDAHVADTTAVHGITDTSALLDSDDIGVSVQAHSAVLDATTAAFTTEDESSLTSLDSRLDAIDALGALATDAELSAAVAERLAKASNLSDLADAATARTNLGLGTAAVAALIDDDTMATASASNIPSAESVKAYVDASSGGVTDHGALDGLADNDHPQYALAASAAKIATGTYTGNGATTDRTIALPFTPAFVYITSTSHANTVDTGVIAGAGDAASWALPSATVAHEITNAAKWVTGTTNGILLRAGNQNGVNFSGDSYDYVAIG